MLKNKPTGRPARQTGKQSVTLGFSLTPKEKAYFLHVAAEENLNNSEMFREIFRHYVATCGPIAFKGEVL